MAAQLKNDATQMTRMSRFFHDNNPCGIKGGGLVLPGTLAARVS